MSAENLDIVVAGKIRAFERVCVVLASCRKAFQQEDRLVVKVEDQGSVFSVFDRIYSSSVMTERFHDMYPNGILIRGIEKIHKSLWHDLQQAGQASLTDRISREVLGPPPVV